MKTLNGFLRSLPELVVDNLIFERYPESIKTSTFHIQVGVWKLRKVGYNEYDLTKLTSEGIFRRHSGWSSSPGVGDITISRIRNSLTGVIVTLGEDAPHED